MITYFGIILLWITYSSIFGYCDAWYWYSANIGKYCDKNFVFNDLHPYFFWKRSIVASVFSLSMAKDNLLMWLPIVICLGLIFPFFHNGFYYQTRHKIDSTKYPLGFMDMSKTSIAPINFTFVIRSIFLLIGLSGLFIIYFI